MNLEGKVNVFEDKYYES